LKNIAAEAAPTSAHPGCWSATLARWLGVNDCDLATIFPYLSNFPTSNLGLMG